MKILLVFRPHRLGIRGMRIMTIVIVRTELILVMLLAG
jgi:hypothetical protein